MNKIKIFNNNATIVGKDVSDWIKKENPNIIQISTIGVNEYSYVLTILYNDTQSISLNS